MLFGQYKSFEEALIFPPYVEYNPMIQFSSAIYYIYNNSQFHKKCKILIHAISNIIQYIFMLSKYIQ